jgi:hypothetical protein
MKTSNMVNVGSSAYSTSTGYQPSSNTNSYYMSPNRVSNSSNFGATSHPMEYTSAPHSAVNATSPGFSSPISALPSLNKVHDPSRTVQEFPPQESRRSSLGSQVNQGLNSLQINGNGNNSPYTGSVNHSTTSLAQNLSRERGITNANGSVRNSRSSGQLPMSPLSPLASETRLPVSTPRIAPPIGRNPRSDVYNAFEPAPGQAYAFPDPPDVKPGDLPPMPGQRSTHSLEDGRTSMFSRRDSGHTSLTGSILTTDSRLPPGQHRLEDGTWPSEPTNGFSDSRSHLSTDMPGTHHHTLQQTSMTSLDAGSPMSTEDGITPYSRTPALRVSHKMAERKRRSEMKDLFENLRSQIPSNQGSKSSKWEILTKGILRSNLILRLS